MFIKKILTFLLIIACAVPLVTQAAAFKDGLKESQSNLGDSAKSSFNVTTSDSDDTYGSSRLVILSTIAGVMWSLLKFVGTILALIIIYAGWLWMTAGGNQDQVSKAQKWMKNAFIGFVLLVFANIIAAFMQEWALRATVGQQGALRGGWFETVTDMFIR